MSGLVSQSMGMHPNTIRSNNNTLQSARYHLKQGSSHLPQFYTSTDEYPIYGTGQGSGNSPFIWCMISSILFDCFQDHCFGATYFLPDYSEALQIGMTGFVDDSNANVNSFSNSTISPTSLLARTEQDAILWQSLLETSGGILEPAKCSFHHIQWDFTSEGTPKLLYEVTFTLALGNLPLLSLFQHLPSNTAHKTLGTFQVPNEKPTLQFQELLKKIINKI